MINKKRKITKSGFVKLFLEYGIHLWIILFVANIAIFYAVHFFLIAATCMTQQQIDADNRCLYVWGTQIFQKGSRASPHVGHPCGTNVTTILPPSHMGNQASYMIPNFVANFCSTTVVPTPTPTMNIVPSGVCLGGICATLTPTPIPPTATPAMSVPTNTPMPSASLVTPTISLNLSGVPTVTPGNSNSILDQILKLLQQLINMLQGLFTGGGATNKTNDNDKNTIKGSESGGQHSSAKSNNSKN